MSALCRRILDELTVFADLGTDVVDGKQTREGFVVRLFRNGDELALVFAEDGRVIERCRGNKPRTHATYLALLASERFGDLRSWAATQARLLGETMAEMGRPIRVVGKVAGREETLAAGELGGFLESIEREDDTVQVVLVDGPAGIGKTKFVEALALERAKAYGRRRHPLVLHVQSRGRVLSYLQDLIAFSLQRLRLSVTFDQVPILVRHGLVTLAIDGFDELGDPNGYDLAWAQLNEALDDVRGAGTLILAGRETFIGLGRLRSALKVLREQDIVHGITLQPPSPPAAEKWLVARGWSNDDLANTRSLLEDEDSYALRPFFLAKLAEIDVARSLRESAGTSLLPTLADLMVDRESRKFGDAVDDALTPEERRQYAHLFLCEVAQYMADDQTDIIGETPLTWLVDMALPEGTDADIVGLLKHRTGTMAFLTNDALPGYRRFSHTQLFNYYLSKVVIDAVSNGEVPKFVRRNIFSADFLAVFVEVLHDVAGKNPNRVEAFFQHAQSWLQDYRAIDRGGRNLGAWIIAALPTMADVFDRRALRIGPLDVDETVLWGTPSEVVLSRVFISQIDVRGADLRELNFQESEIATAIVDAGTRVSETFPVPKLLRVQDGAGKEVRDPVDVKAWLRAHAPADEDPEQVMNERREQMLRVLGRACRSPTFWIPETGGTTVSKFVNDPAWPRALAVLEDHGFVRREQRGVSGRQSGFVHIKQRRRILANDPSDDQVRTLYATLEAAACEE